MKQSTSVRVFKETLALPLYRTVKGVGLLALKLPAGNFADGSLQVQQVEGGNYWGAATKLTSWDRLNKGFLGHVAHSTDVVAETTVSVQWSEIYGSLATPHIRATTSDYGDYGPLSNEQPLLYDSFTPEHNTLSFGAVRRIILSAWQVTAQSPLAADASKTLNIP